MSAPTRSNRLAGSITQSTDEVANNCDWPKEDVAGNAANQRRKVRNYHVISPVWPILLSCERLVEAAARATEHRERNYERNHRAEHAHRRQTTQSVGDDGRREDQYVKHLACISGA